MKNKQVLILSLFAVVSFLMIATPLALIWKHERILTEGKIFKFRTAPVDPFDAFRGRYVALSLEENKVSMPEGMDLKSNDKICANVIVGEDGFAKISGLSKYPPIGLSYIKAKVRYIGGKDREVFLDLPIDRYYMEEKAAKLAEAIYARHSTREKRDAYVIVRIQDGNVAIEGLYIGGVPIEEVIKKEKQFR